MADGLYKDFQRRAPEVRDYYLSELQVAFNRESDKALAQAAYGGSRHALTLMSCASDSIGTTFLAFRDELVRIAQTYPIGLNLSDIQYMKLELDRALRDFADTVRDRLREQVERINQLNHFAKWSIELETTIEKHRVSTLESFELAFIETVESPNASKFENGNGRTHDGFRDGPFFGLAEGPEASRAADVTFVANQFNAGTVIVLQRDDPRYSEILKGFGDLENAFKYDNAFGSTVEGARAIVETRASRELLSGGAIRVEHIKYLVLPVLSWLALECAGSLIGDIAKGLVKLAAALFGFEILGLE